MYRRELLTTEQVLTVNALPSHLATDPTQLTEMMESLELNDNKTTMTIIMIPNGIDMVNAEIPNSAVESSIKLLK